MLQHLLSNITSDCLGPSVLDESHVGVLFRAKGQAQTERMVHFAPDGGSVEAMFRNQGDDSRFEVPKDNRYLFVHRNLFRADGTRAEGSLCPESTLNIGRFVYDLAGIVMHKGESLQGGHFYSYTKRRGPRWYKCDDEGIELVDFESVQGDTNNCYVLVYFRNTSGMLDSPPPL